MAQLRFLILATFIILSSIRATRAGLCEVEGQSNNIILDIEESRGKSISQETIPAELPITGEPNVDIFLDLSFPKGPSLFFLNGKKLQLLAPLDRDENSLSHIVFQLICTVKSTHRKRTIPIIVRLSDINDNAPQFVGTPYETSISELTPVGTTIYQDILAKDKDTGVNGLVDYSIVKSENFIQPDEGLHSEDGYGHFAINFPHQGQVTVNRTLDFEKTQRYYLTILATDRARDESDRLSSTTTLIVNIKDDDDQNPAFIYKGCMLLDGTCINPEYSASVSSGILHGILNISPEKIQAVDMDTLNFPIRYSFVSGSPDSYEQYFQIDSDSGAVRQIAPVDTSTTKQFNIIIKAQEISEAKRSTTAKLRITIKPVDSHPPELLPTSLFGHIPENSPLGTTVLTSNSDLPLQILVRDPDLAPTDPHPPYTFELTTPFFSISPTGHLLVQRPLDRDPPHPSHYKFQIVAREPNSTAASAPLTLTVHLDDVNDNPPLLPPIPPITVPAGDSKRRILTIHATDNDEGDNAKVFYSIYHVSNNGGRKFAINEQNGDLEAISKLNAGEQYSLTVQATDSGGLYSQAIVEVKVSPGPNTQSPQFEQASYDVEVSEGATINSTIANLVAKDAEDDPIVYSIESGNDLRQFAIGAQSGTVSVIRKLDREEITRYKLVVKAEDAGKLSSSTTLNIRVTDINDKNPEFVDAPYKFAVKEGVKGGRVGAVKAVDADEGINAEVTYTIPEGLPFGIDGESGEIRTLRALDYETQKTYEFVVTAQDGAPDPRLATATVTVSVEDVEDEVPTFPIENYEATVPENMPDYLVIEVRAEDPDTVKKITYVIQQGPTDLFRIDDQTGSIFTTRGLDYEKESRHVLVVGTLENMSSLKNSTTKVVVNVEDRNDIPPVFTMVPHPITLEDDVAIGTPVASLVATDSDGTAPGNQVRYELIGRAKSQKYFQIDPTSGTIRITNDLKKELDTEYQLDVRAHDLGDPQLSSVITLDVYIRHVATVAPEVGLRFADTLYHLQVPENATSSTTTPLKTLPIVNAKAHGTHIPLKCGITAGNAEGKFIANLTADRNCALYLNASLDFETEEAYQLDIEIMGLQGFINQEFAKTHVTITVVDINDNPPFWLHNSTKFYASIPTTSPILTPVIQIKADDKDSGKFGKLTYKLENDNQTHNFQIDTTTGLVKTLQTFTANSPSPFHLTVKARDNPTSQAEYHEIESSLIVNLIKPENRLILVIGDAKPDQVQAKLPIITSVLEEHTKLVAGIEKLTAREHLNQNGTLENDASATDVYFYLIDPTNDVILARNDSKVEASMLDKVAMDRLTFELSGRMQHTVFNVHEPLVAPRAVKVATLGSFNGDVFPYALIVIACVIFVLGLVGIVYICVSWARYKAYRAQARREFAPNVSPARYDAVYVEPNLKEYETQVLQMCVPVDEQEEYDLRLDFSNKNHAFSLDNVSYISKDHQLSKFGQQSPVSSESATTARASSVGDNMLKIMDRRDHIYRSSDEEEMNTSPSNSNVMFREKKDYSHLGYSYDHSPVETTTEL